MEKIKLRVTENQIEVLKRPAVITAGTVGLEAEFMFDSQWDTLSKILVFKAGEKVVTTALTGYSCIVPWEVLEHPKQWLRVGVYGANGEGTVVIPTLWAEVAVIHTGADPTGDPATDPTLPIWQEAVTLAEQGAAAEQELRSGVDSLAQELNITNESPNLGDAFSELLVLDRENAYRLNEHTDDRENPHHVTCEQIGAATLENLIDVNVQIQGVSDLAHNNAVEIAIHTNTEDNPNPHEITCKKIGAMTKDEVDAAVAEGKAVIVTVDNAVSSHSSQEIYALVQGGKAVYLYMWGDTYMLCTASTANEAKFENSYLATATGADGQSYDIQRFRLFYIYGNRQRQNTLDVPGKAYIDAQIQYYLNN